MGNFFIFTAKKRLMSTAQRIQNEILSLPSNLQSQVLAYVEWLKYRELIQETAELAASQGGIQTLTEEDNYRLFEQDMQGTQPENLAEKLALIERVKAALTRMQLGVAGISNQEMIERAQQWRKQ
jgi:hypothetical protein